MNLILCRRVVVRLLHFAILILPQKGTKSTKTKDFTTRISLEDFLLEAQA
jgi:hypothetical protein